MAQTTGIPDGVKTPFFYLNICDGTLAIPESNCEVVIIGPKLPAGAATPGVKILITSLFQAGVQFSTKSILYDMVKTYMAHPNVSTVYCIPMAEEVGWSPAQATVTITGPATSAGSFAIRFGNKRYVTDVEDGDSASQIATRLGTAIGGDEDRMFSASRVAGVVTVEMFSGGALGNEMTFVLNPEVGDEAGMPTGITVTVEGDVAEPGLFGGGVGDPDIADGLDTLGECPFACVISAYNDPTNVDTLCDFFNCATGRWSWRSMLYGLGFVAYRGNASRITFLGNLTNCEHISPVGNCRRPSKIQSNTTWQMASTHGALMCYNSCNDPAVSFHNQRYYGVECGGVTRGCDVQCFTFDEFEIITSNGVSTWKCHPGGYPVSHMAITNLQVLPSEARVFQPIQYQMIHQFLARQLIDWAKTNWDGKKIANNGTSITKNRNTLTPDLMKAMLVSFFQGFEGDLVEDLEGLEKALVIERDDVNPSRVNIYLYVNPIDPNLIVATKFSLVSNYRFV
jgi:phage tail sheath gpL-like